MGDKKLIDTPEEHEIIDAWIGDVACFSPDAYHGSATMEADIDGEWVRYEDVKAAILAKLKETSNG